MIVNRLCAADNDIGLNMIRYKTIKRDDQS